MDCIFCSIAQKDIEAAVVHENEQFVVFKDIEPKAPVHLLIIPKEHIGSLLEVAKEQAEMVGTMMLLANQLAKENDLAGYTLQMNVGKEGGQEVDHMHLHMLGKKT